MRTAPRRDGESAVQRLLPSMAGVPLFPSFGAGWGAAVGRFWGTISKLAIGVIMVLVLALAAFF